MYDSLTTKDTKIGTVQYLIEKIILSTVKPAPFFWSKKKCPNLSLDVYRANTTLYGCLRSVIKSYGEEIVVAAVTSFDYKQLRKIYQFAHYSSNVGKIIAGLKYYCEDELARNKRVVAPKDVTEAAPLRFDVGLDMRTNKTRKKRQCLWSLIKDSNIEGKISGEED